MTRVHALLSLPRSFLRDPSSYYSLLQDQVRSYVAQADVNKDGTIDYAEFVPFAMELLSQNTPWVDSPPPSPVPVPPAPPPPPRGLLASSYDDDQLQEYFKKLFEIGDTNGDGVTCLPHASIHSLPAADQSATF